MNVASMVKMVTLVIMVMMVTRVMVVMIVTGVHFRLTCSHPELTKDHVLTSAYVKIFRTVMRNAVNKSVLRKKDCS